MRTIVATCLALGVALSVTPAQAPAVRVLCSNGLRAVLQAIAPDFERSSSLRLQVDFAPTAVLAERIAGGQPFDLAVLTPEAVDAAAAAGRIDGATRVTVARSLLGLAMKAGGTRPSIDTVDGLARTLRAARSISFATQGASAKPFEAIVDRLGLADIRGRYQLRETGVQVGEAVATGVAEFGVIPVSEILPIAGVALAGVFPDAVQSPLLMVGALASRATNRAGAEALLRHLQAPEQHEAFVSRGMDRPPRP